MISCNLALREVYIKGERLSPGRSQELINHSPDGFSWGYGGSGPSQLALALLLHFTNDDHFSLAHYQSFKFDVVAKWDQYRNVSVPNRVVIDWAKSHGWESK
jgi:Family of unknown function (DUF6166)